MGRTNLQLEWFFLQVEHLKVNLLIRQLKNLATYNHILASRWFAGDFLKKRKDWHGPIRTEWMEYLQLW